MRTGEQQYALPVAYFQKEEEAGGKKGPAAAAVPAVAAHQRQQQQVCHGNVRLIRSDCGEAYLAVSAAATSTRTAARQQYAEPQPYFSAAAV